MWKKLTTIKTVRSSSRISDRIETPRRYNPPENAMTFKLDLVSKGTQGMLAGRKGLAVSIIRRLEVDCSPCICNYRGNLLHEDFIFFS
jgi:hypothetical protein